MSYVEQEWIVGVCAGSIQRYFGPFPNLEVADMFATLRLDLNSLKCWYVPIGSAKKKGGSSS